MTLVLSRRHACGARQGVMIERRQAEIVAQQIRAPSGIGQWPAPIGLDWRTLKQRLAILFGVSRSSGRGRYSIRRTL